jgi:5-methylcytosine-specific restriction enzyme A
MSFNPNIEQGQVSSNKELCEIFQCSPQGGMRRSLKTNSLLIISDHTKAIYEDRWINDIFHYTGMGLKGTQSLDFAQNKTLYESSSNGVQVFLFEVFEEGKYQYQGSARLSDKPYQEEQPDIEGNIRNVWIFPLKLIDESRPSLISERVFKERQVRREKKASKLSIDELRKKSEKAPKKSGVRDIVSKQYERNQFVAAYAKKRANGVCQLCSNPAPFKDNTGEPFLEVHHIDWLSNEGEDSIENTVALCPNCHRKMHVVNEEKDKLLLKEVAREVGTKSEVNLY